MSTAVSAQINAAEQHLVLDAVSYDQFVAFTDALGARPGLRVSFDGQRLEVMTLSRRHELWKKVLGRLIEDLTLELGMPLASGGQTTFRNPTVERGLEPDECYWIQHAEMMRGVGDWDSSLHPSPDLAIEIDVSDSRVDRREIYSQLGVEELWQFDGAKLLAFRRNEDGAFYSITHSVAFPGLAVTDLLPFLEAAGLADENEIRRRFLKWVRSQNFPPQPQS
jgi:Uma2 family endonuclease